MSDSVGLRSPWRSCISRSIFSTSSRYPSASDRVDYAVNLVQRRVSEPGISIIEVLRTTGGAIVLCSLTTTIGTWRW